MDHLKSGVLDQPGQHGETPSLLKIQKLTGCGGGVLVVPAAWEAEGRESTQEAEVAVSRDHATALQRGQHNKALAEKKKNTKTVTEHRRRTSLQVGEWSWKVSKRRYIL